MLIADGLATNQLNGAQVAADEEQPADAVDNGIVDHDEEAKDAGEEPATAPEELSEAGCCCTGGSLGSWKW